MRSERLYFLANMLGVPLFNHFRDVLDCLFLVFVPKFTGVMVFFLFLVDFNVINLFLLKIFQI